MRNRKDIERAVDRSRPEIVFHLAHYGGNRDQSDSEEIRRVIIDGTAALYESCARSNTVVHIVNTGSSSEYGSQKESMREDMLPEPNTEYGVAKVWATLYGEHLRREKDLPITTLRLFSVYGPYEAPIRFFPGVIRALMKSTLPTLSNPDTVRDFVHVDDVVAACLQATRAAPGVYNVGSGMQTRLENVASLIKQSMGSTEHLVWGGESGRGFDTQSWRADTTRARNVLGWQADISLEQGIVQTISWFKQNAHLYDH
jgi:dolichol-phosphate mannosyltransferase